MLPAGGETSGCTGGGDAVGVVAGGVGFAGGGEEARGDGLGVDRGGGEEERDGEGEGFVGAARTTMLPFAVPAALVAVTRCVVPAGPAT